MHDGIETPAPGAAATAAWRGTTCIPQATKLVGEWAFLAPLWHHHFGLALGDRTRLMRVPWPESILESKANECALVCVPSNLSVASMANLRRSLFWFDDVHAFDDTPHVRQAPKESRYALIELTARRPHTGSTTQQRKVDFHTLISAMVLGLVKGQPLFGKSILVRDEHGKPMVSVGYCEQTPQLRIRISQPSADVPAYEVYEYVTPRH